MKKEVKLNELSNFVKNFLSSTLWAHQNVFGLFGNLGAGKTTFTKEVAKQLGVKEEITSPTFTILQSYDINFGDFKKLIHIDLYRIENEKELEVLNLKEIFQDKSNLVLIEWADQFPNFNFGRINFDYNDEDSRLIEIQNG